MTNTMSEEEEKVRQRYIQQGLIKPCAEIIPEGERPPMNAEEIQRYRKKLIDAGLLKPGKFPPRQKRYH